MQSYKIKTTKLFEHDRGVFWEAQLLKDGKKIGTITQMGTGGADRVYIDDRSKIKDWNAFCENMGGEELATFALMLEETSSLSN